MEAKLGELFNQMPKATTNNPHGNNQFRSNSLREEIDPVESESAPADEAEPPQKPKPKLEIAAQMGFNKNQVADFQKLADNPAAVTAKVTAKVTANVTLRLMLRLKNRIAP